MKFDRYVPLLIYLLAVGAYLPARRLYDVIEELASSSLARGDLTSPYYAALIAGSVGWLIAGTAGLALILWVLGKLRRVFEAAELYEREMRRRREEYDMAVESGQDDPRPLRYGWHRTSR